MKPLKICWYGLMAALLFLGLLTGRREAFLLLFIMGFVALYSLLLNLWTVFSFTYTQKIDNDVCVKGGETSMRITVHNENLFPFALIRLAAAPVARSQKARFDFSLPPYSRASFTLPLPCPYRGVFGVGMTELEVNDSFGLVKTRFNMLNLPYYRQPKVKVYPRLVELPFLSARQSDSKHFGSDGRQYAEHGESYAELRRYRPGDALKRLHRAACARRRELYVRTYDMPFETSVLIALDTAVGDTSGEAGLYLADLACECAAAIANYSLRAGYRVIFCCDVFPGGAEAFESVKSFSRLYDTLAALEFHERQDGFAGILRKIPAFGARAAYVISARKDAGISEALAGPGIGNVTLLSLVERRDARAALPDAVSKSGIWAVQVAVGDDLAAVLGEEAGLV